MSESSLSPVPFAMLRGMSNGRRLALIGALVLLVAGIGLVGRWASSPTYATLFRDLDLKEAGEIGDQLTKSNVPWRLATGGTEVEVPVAVMARARVALAKQGLPISGRPGLELFDKPSWGMTDFTQRVTFQRALEGELGRTLGQIDGVERAEVHLVLPAPSAVRRNERPAGASVVLTLRGGGLAAETVQGMAYIVSNSVEGLAADNVAIMDATGRLLSAPSAGLAGAGLTGRQLEAQHGLEQHLVERIEGLVATVVGQGRVRAQVAAQLEFEQVEQTTETYSPDGQVLQDEQRSEGSAGDGTGQQTVINNRYQNSHKLERSQSAVGRLARLTIAVLVDEKSLRAERERELADLDVMIRDAAGLDSTRGDRLTVLAVPFEPQVAAAVAANEKPRVDPVQVAERFSRPVVGLIAVIALLFVAMQVVRSLAPPARPGASATPPGLAAAAASSEPAPPETLPSPGDLRVVRLKDRLRQDSTDKPENTAQVLRAWLADRT